MYKKGWARDLHMRWASLYTHSENLLVTERGNYLTKINPSNGKILWQVKINSAYNWVRIYKNKVYVLSQNSLLKIIKLATGEVEKEHQFKPSYLRYLVLSDDYLITGSWRAYTDLTCFNRNEQLSINWTKPTKSKKSKSYALPLIQGNHLFIANNTAKFLSKINLQTGQEHWRIKLPNDVGTVDMGYNFGILKGTIIFYTQNGHIYRLNEKDLEWQAEIIHPCGIQTIKPIILEHQYLFQDAENFICSYDIEKKQLRWKIYSNHFNTIIPAIELKNDLTLLGVNMGRQRIVNKDGKIVTELSTEKRYGSNFMRINDDLFYLTKSKLVQLKRTKK